MTPSAHLVKCATGPSSPRVPRCSARTGWTPSSFSAPRTPRTLLSTHPYRQAYLDPTKSCLRGRPRLLYLLFQVYTTRQAEGHHKAHDSQRNFSPSTLRGTSTSRMQTDPILRQAMRACFHHHPLECPHDLTPPLLPRQATIIIAARKPRTLLSVAKGQDPALCIPILLRHRRSNGTTREGTR